MKKAGFYYFFLFLLFYCLTEVGFGVDWVKLKRKWVGFCFRMGGQDSGLGWGVYWAWVGVGLSLLGLLV